MANATGENLEAVFIFQGDKLARELLYPEFEAILDAFIPIPEFANQSARVVYVRINSALCVTGCVFFLLGFDEKGMVDRRWNVPLYQLLDAADSGPDMGAGPIKLVCYSQCPIAWHQKNLWDPQMQSGANSLVAIRKSVKANRVGLVFRSLQNVDSGTLSTAQIQQNQRNLEELEREQLAFQKKLHEQYSQEVRDKIASLHKEQRLRIAALSNQQQQEKDSLQQDHQQRLQAYYHKMREMEQHKHELTEQNQQLQEKLAVQINKIEGVREYFTHKLRKVQEGEAGHLESLQESFAQEAEFKVQTATAALREMLDMREVELFYRHQNESALKDEIVSLKRENQQLLKTTSDQLLSRLAQNGVGFVAFLPGVGETTITLDEMGHYLASPQVYAAEKAGVGEALYFAWLEHSERGCCAAPSASGEVCGNSIPVVVSPLAFHPGESDRCHLHQAISLRRSAEQR
jgi:hypothetical protein